MASETPDAECLLNKVAVGILDGSVSAVRSDSRGCLNYIVCKCEIWVQRLRLIAHTFMLPDLSRTKHTILFPICSNEKVGLGGGVVIGVVFLKSSESRITSQVLRRLHFWFCRFGASLLWFVSVQNSTT